MASSALSSLLSVSGSYTLIASSLSRASAAPPHMLHVSGSACIPVPDSERGGDGNLCLQYGVARGLWGGGAEGGPAAPISSIWLLLRLRCSSADLLKTESGMTEIWLLERLIWFSACSDVRSSGISTNLHPTTQVVRNPAVFLVVSVI
eukprot:340465-Rhodomonas_salina.6